MSETAATATDKTRAGWNASRLDLSHYLQPGDTVDQEMAGYFIEVLPPAYHTSKIRQIGEPYSFCDGAETYSTLELCNGQWTYRGHCHQGKTHEPGEICPDDINGRYIRSHGAISEEAKELCRHLKAMIESQTALGKPAPGDIIVAHGHCNVAIHGKEAGPITYSQGHIESFGGWEDHKFHCCVQPSEPFTYDENGLGFSTSGGYWFGCKPEELTHAGTRKKIFWTWGGRPCADGGVRFEARVNVWDYTDTDKIY